jgi:RHS repeat-associated protein
MPGRTYPGSNKYRYGYQGQFAEKDNETNSSNFELRQWNGLLGRWSSIDPYGQYHSPYLGMGNNPVNFIDPDGGNDDIITLDSKGHEIKREQAPGEDIYISTLSVVEIFSDNSFTTLVCEALAGPSERTRINNRYNGVQGYRQYQSYSNYYPGETQFDRFCRNFAAAHSEEMLDYCGGGYNMFGTSRAAAAAEESEILQTTTRVGKNGNAVEIIFKNGNKTDINAARVKEWTPNSHSSAPAGALQKVKFPNAIPGSKGFKRLPTQGEIDFLNNLFK